MKLHPRLVLAIFAAVVWACIVMGAYFAVILLIPAVEDWSTSDRIQAFAAAIGAAGFGGGLIALFFAGQQLTHLFANPELSVAYRAHGQEISGQRLTGLRTGSNGEAARVDLTVEVVNHSDVICDLWQVVVTAPRGAIVMGGEGWITAPEGQRTLYQAKSGEALYPQSPRPLGAVLIAFSLGAFSTDSAGRASWAGGLLTTIATRGKKTEQNTEFRLLVPPPKEHVDDWPMTSLGPTPDEEHELDRDV